MDIKEAVLAGLKELILPELNRIKEDTQEMKTAQLLINKRLDDMNMHLIDQSRRIDEVNKRIDERICEVNKHIDERIGEVNKHIDERIGEVNERITELKEGVSLNTIRIDEINKRLDRLYEVIVRRDEHDKLESRMIYLEQQVNEIRLKLAA